MRRLRLLYSIIFFVSLLKIGTAQELDFNFGNSIPSVKWKCINSDTLRVIFPAELESQANRVSSIIHTIAKDKHQTIGDRIKKLELVLQNQTVISNGYVSLLPFRSEFYTNPLHQSNELGSINWLDLLAIHEYRHAVQLANTKKGFIKFMSLLFGQAGWAGFTNLYTPDWFFEGDAVLTETSLTKQGRGRIPRFLNEYRALSLDRKRYNYQKVRNNSFKDYVPNHYALGFLLSKYGRDEYGRNFWKNVLDQSSKGERFFYNFGQAVKSKSGITMNKFYNNAFDKYYNNWLKDTLSILESSATAIVPSETNKAFTSYTFLQPFNDTSLFCVKSGFNNLAQLINLSIYGNEKPITYLGFKTSSYFTYSSHKLAWSELQFDVRYQNRNYHNIVVFDLKTNRKKRITTKQKLFSPCFSAGGDSILAVQQLLSGENNLVLVNSNSGKILSLFLNENKYFYCFPKLSNDGNQVVSLVRNASGEMGIISQSLSTNEQKTLLEFTNNILSEPFLRGNDLFFQATFNGKDQIYAFNIISLKLYRVTNRLYGCYYPILMTDQQTVAFTEFTSDGNRPMMMQLDTNVGNDLVINELHELESSNTNAFLQEGGDILKSLNERKFETKNYNGIKHMVNIHSWTIKPSLTHIGLDVFSDNVLNNFKVEAGAYYHFDEKVMFYKTKVSYAGIFPIVFAEYEKVKSRSIDATNNKIVVGKLVWDETQASAGFRIPLNFSKGIYDRKMHLQTSGYYIEGQYKSSLRLPNYNIFAMSHHLAFENSKQKTYRNYISRFGQYLFAEYNYGIENSRINRLQIVADLSFKGFGADDIFLLRSSYKEESLFNTYRWMDNKIRYNGYYLFGFSNVQLLQVNYQFTLAYPDIGLAGILYCKRIRASIYNQTLIAKSTFSGETTQLNSYGLEIISDLKIFNLVPIQFGLRWNLPSIQPKREGVQYTDFEIFVPVYNF